MSTTVEPRPDDTVIAERPRPGAPRPYEFPAVASHQLSNGLSVLVANLPGRPLISASMVIRGGASEEPAELAGSTVLAARALSEGTERFDAIQLVEADRAPGRLAPRRRRLGRPQRQRRRSGRSARAGARARRRGPAATDLPDLRGRAAARRAPERPAPGPGRPTAPGRAGIRRHDLRRGLALPSPVGRNARDRGAVDRYRPPARLRAQPGPATRHPRRRRGPRRAGRRRAGRADVRPVAGVRSGPRERIGRRHGGIERANRQGRPSTGFGPDRDPDRASRTAAPDPGLPRRLGDERHPGRPVQLLG